MWSQDGTRQDRRQPEPQVHGESRQHHQWRKPKMQGRGRIQTVTPAGGSSGRGGVAGWGGGEGRSASGSAGTLQIRPAGRLQSVRFSVGT